MALNYSLNFLRIVLILLFGSLCHVLNILILVQRHFEGTYVCVHALKDLPILYTCLEKGWIKWKLYDFFETFMLFKGINTMLL